jgi:hypothetical protein
VVVLHGHVAIRLMDVDRCMGKEGFSSMTLGK